MHFLKQYTAKTLLLFMLLSLTVGGTVFLSFFYTSVSPLWLKITFMSIVTILLTLFFIMYFKKKSFIYKLLFILIIFASIAFIIYILLLQFGVLGLLESGEQTAELIRDTGNYGKVIFMLIQFAQVAIIPIPAMITTLAGVAVYGAFEAFVLSTVAIILGSLFSFFVWGRLLGYRMVKWVAGEEQTNKYRDLLNQKGKYLFVLMLIMPVFPDDILCTVAGITSMSGRFFTITTILLRPLTTFMICYISGGQIIPYSGWGLIAWPFLLVLMGIMFIWTYKHTEQIESYISNLPILKRLNKKA